MMGRLSPTIELIQGSDQEEVKDGGQEGDKKHKHNQADDSPLERFLNSIITHGSGKNDTHADHGGGADENNQDKDGVDDEN